MQGQLQVACRYAAVMGRPVGIGPGMGQGQPRRAAQHAVMPLVMEGRHAGIKAPLPSRPADAPLDHPPQHMRRIRAQPFHLLRIAASRRKTRHVQTVFQHIPRHRLLPVMPDGAPPPEQVRTLFGRHPHRGARRQKLPHAVKHQGIRGADGNAVPAAVAALHVRLRQNAFLVKDTRDILRTLIHAAAATHAAAQIYLQTMLHLLLPAQGGMTAHSG